MTIQNRYIVVMCLAVIAGSAMVPAGDVPARLVEITEADAALLSVVPSRDTEGKVNIDDPRMSFVVGVGSGWHGLHVVAVRGDGQIDCYFFEVVKAIEPKSGEVGKMRRWRHASFALTPDTMKSLVTEIKESKLESLQREYNGDRADGTQVLVALRDPLHEKLVYCNNYFPAEIRTLLSFVERSVIRPNNAKLEAAKEIPWTSQDSWKAVEQPTATTRPETGADAVLNP